MVWKTFICVSKWIVLYTTALFIGNILQYEEAPFKHLLSLIMALIGVTIFYVLKDLERKYKIKR